MKKILYAPLKLIPLHWPHRDKWGHALVGLILFGIITFFSPSVVALGIVISVALGKEIYDYFTDGEASVLDFLATILLPLVLYLV